MKKHICFWGSLAILASSVVAGCAGLGLPMPERWLSTPATATVENAAFTASITPRCHGLGCEAFAFTLVNKTDKNLELDWNKTLFVTGGQTSGGFMFEGIVYRDRNNQKSADVIFAKGTLTKTIWPNNLVSFSAGRYGGWDHGSMPRGENGAYLTVVLDGKELHEKLVVALTTASKQ